MTLTTAQLKAAIEAKIAAATGSTTLEDLTIIKRLADTWLANNSNGSIAGYSSLVSLLQTRQNALTGSSTLDDMTLAGVAAFPPKAGGGSAGSYVAEGRTFANASIEYLPGDGSRWLRTGFFETDPQKIDSNAWPNAYFSNTGLNVAWSVGSDATVPLGRQVVVLNSGKKIAFSHNSNAAAITSFATITSPLTTVKSATETYLDYSYDSSTDTLWLVRGNGQGLTRITSDGTVVTEIANATYGGNSNARSIVARNGRIYVGMSQQIRCSTNNGTSWTNYTNTGLPSGSITHIGYCPSTNSVTVLRDTSTFPTSPSSSFALHVSTNDGIFSAQLSPASGNPSGAVMDFISYDSCVVFCVVRNTYFQNSETGVESGNELANVYVFNTESRFFNVVVNSSSNSWNRITKIFPLPDNTFALFRPADSVRYTLEAYSVASGSPVVLGSNTVSTFFPLHSSTTVQNGNRGLISGFVENGRFLITHSTTTGAYGIKAPAAGSPNSSTYTHVRIS